MEEKKKSNKIMFAVLGIVIVALIGIVVFLVLKLNNENMLNNNQNTVNSLENNEQQIPIATMQIKDYGTVKIELYPDIAPKTVENFITLANNGFYDNLTFHRIVKGFMIQGGDKKGDGTGKITLNDIYNNGSNEEHKIEGEFEANGHKNDLKHTEGVISMARADYTYFAGDNQTIIKEGYNSASCQFFIMTNDSPELDGQYASFGKVIEGMDIIHKIENIPTEESDYGENSKPVNPPIIEKIRVETIISNNEKNNITDKNDTTQSNINKEGDTTSDDNTTADNKSKEKINAKARSIAAQNDLNFICTEVYKTLKNGNDVILISMSDPQYSPAQYFLLVEFDSSLEVIKYSDFLRNDDNITLRSAYLPIWGYAEGETTF